MSRVFDALQQSDSSEYGTRPLNLLSSLAQEEPDFDAVKAVEARVTPESRLVSVTDPQSVGAEQFRVLAAKLGHLRFETPIRTVLVTSSTVDEGKSLVASNLALALGRRADRKVLLIEGDLRRPLISALLGLNGLEGLAEWWANSQWSIKQVVYKIAGSRLWFLPAGRGGQPDEMLQSKRVSDLLPRLAPWFDWVIIDSPPLLPFADSGSWSRIADGVLFVVREGITSMRFLTKAIEQIDKTKLLGVVINDAAQISNHHYYHYYHYHQKPGDN